jgi:hypothetical protein
MPRGPGAVFELLCLGWSLVSREMTQVLLGKVNRPKIRMSYEGCSHWPPSVHLQSFLVTSLHSQSRPVAEAPTTSCSLILGSWLRFGPTPFSNDLILQWSEQESRPLSDSVLMQEPKKETSLSLCSKTFISYIFFFSLCL